jgi:hypothetical protein
MGLLWLETIDGKPGDDDGATITHQKALIPRSFLIKLDTLPLLSIRRKQEQSGSFLVIWTT